MNSIVYFGYLSMVYICLNYYYLYQLVLKNTHYEDKYNNFHKV